jgi:hypothetical protein
MDLVHALEKFAGGAAGALFVVTLDQKTTRLAASPFDATFFAIRNSVRYNLSERHCMLECSYPSRCRQDGRPSRYRNRSGNNSAQE